MSQTFPPCYGIIPARYASSRFPGKPLVQIQGKPMFWHVYERTMSCPFVTKAILATDDARIEQAAQELNVPVVMTKDSHQSGTDRVFEAATILGVKEDAVVVNIQGDEPALHPDMLSQLLEPFTEPHVQVTTLAREANPTLTWNDVQNPDRPKVVVNTHGDALYFSRSAIPWMAGLDAGTEHVGENNGFLLHIGMYAFRLPALRSFTNFPASPLERREKLEQLRLLDNGIPIRVVRTPHTCHGVDRPEDIAIIEKLLTENIPCKQSSH